MEVLERLVFADLAERDELVVLTLVTDAKKQTERYAGGLLAA